jgi:hypothetical protein
MTMESTGVATVSVAARIAALQKKLGEDENRHKPRPEPEKTSSSAGSAAGRIVPFLDQQNTASYKPPVAKPTHVSTQAVVTVEDGNNDDATAFSSKTPVADNTKKKKSYTRPDGRSSILREATNIMRNGKSVMKDKGYMLSSKAGSSSKEVKQTKRDQTEYVQDVGDKQAVLGPAYEHVDTTISSGKDQVDWSEKVARSAEIIGVDKTGVVLDYPPIKIEDSLHEVSLGDSLLKDSLLEDSLLEDSLLEDSLLKDSLLEDSLLEISLIIDDVGGVEAAEKNVEKEERSPLAAQRLRFDTVTPSKTNVSSVLFPQSPFSLVHKSNAEERGPKDEYQKIRVVITPIGKKKATVVTPSKEDANESVNIQAVSPFTQLALKSISRQEQKAVDENEKILLDLRSKEKNKEGDKLCSQQDRKAKSTKTKSPKNKDNNAENEAITFPATFLEWGISSQAAGPINGKKDIRIRPNFKDVIIKGKKDAGKGLTAANERIRLLVTPKTGENNPTSKLMVADSSLGQTQPPVEEDETGVELEVSFSNNDDEGPMVTCGFENNMFVFHCNEDNVDSILEDVMTGIWDVANIMFLGIDGVNRVFENSLGVATNLERAYKEEVKAQDMKSTGQVVTPPVSGVKKKKSRLFRKCVSNEVQEEEVKAQELTSTGLVAAPTGASASKEKSRLIRECVSNKLKKCMLGLRKKEVC